MRICFAPLEGVTDDVFRRVHHARFNGIDRYFIPFVSPTQNLVFTGREMRAVAPENNRGVPAVPQILTKDAGQFLWAAQALADLGYAEVNLNLGCPSGTVTAKGKGAGMLRDPGALTAFLDEVYAKAPVPVSVKTRIGYEDAAEWPELLRILTTYPLKELIIHPRTRNEFYGGEIHCSAYAQAMERTQLPLIYNGDLFTAQDCRSLMAAYPGTSALMLGRGLLANPALAREACGGAPLQLAELREFHDALVRAYEAQYQENVTLGRMREVMNHITCCFEAPEKPRKAIRKAKTLSAYRTAAEMLFEGHALREQPCFRRTDNE